jgi:anthranilate synthase component 1
MEIIESLEQSRRGPYTGSIGVFGFDGKATLNITIRTITHVDSQFRLRVGAGIVHDSIPEAEYAETLDKAGGLIEAMNEALGERTSLSVAQHPIESVHEETVDAAQSAGGSQ